MMPESTPTPTPTRTAESVRAAPRRVDDDGWIGHVLVAAMVALALVTGLNYTFSVAVMPALADADDSTFVEITQRFNDNPMFQVTYFVALALMVVAPLVQRRHGSGVALRWTVAALVLYGIVVAVTLGVHVPLNDDIDQVSTSDGAASLAEARDDFEDPWVAWHVVRTVLSTAAVAAFGRALLLQGRSTADRTEASTGESAGPAPAATFPAPPPPSSGPTPDDRSVR
jgi:uncharacterized membrane protein